MLIAMCSLKGSPGVTTAALALAACWPHGEQPVVVECDGVGGDLLARFRLQTTPDLVTLVAAGRRSAHPGLVWQHAQQLPGGLRVVPGPAGALQARASLEELAAQQMLVLRRGAERAGTVVIADCGRIDADSPARALTHAADVTLLLTTARDDALSHVAARLEEATRWSRRLWLVLVGEGYPVGEVASALRIEVNGHIPHDPRGAEALRGQAGHGRTAGRSALGRTMAAIATALSTSHEKYPAQAGLAPPLASMSKPNGHRNGHRPVRPDQGGEQ